MPDASSDFYREPIADLSQGDLVEISPHAYLDPPLRRVRVRSDGGVELAEVSTGELLGGAEVVAWCSPGKALILNYDCEIAKQGTARLVLCPVVSLSQFNPADRGNVKRNRTAHLFFLPRFQDRIEDSAAILNQLTTVHRVLLSNLRRLATLGTTGRLAFYNQFVRWLTRWELRTVVCPNANCRCEFDPTLGLPIRSAEDP